MTSLFGTNVTPTGPYQETCGSRFCEPYVLVTSIRLCPPRPEVEVLLYGAWQSTNPDDDADIIPLVWREDILRFDVIAAPIAKPGDVVILINLAEHFDGNPSACRRMIKKSMIEALDASTCLARETRIARLIDEIDRVVDVANGGPNFTSAVEISLTIDDTLCLETIGCCTFVRSFCGYGGQYCLAIELVRAEPDLWTLVLQQDVAFAWAAE